MIRFLIRRLIQSVPLLLGVTLLSFALLKSTPGGPLSIYLESAAVRRADIAQLRAQLGLDDPLPVQYAKWVGNLLRGDWGYSYVTREPVVDRIRQRVPNTIYLMGVAFALGLVIAIPVGLLAALRPYSWFDTLATAGALLGVSMPPFWLGLLLILLFSVQLGWLPTSGLATIGSPFDPLDRLKHLAMPAGVLAFVLAGGYARYVRAAMLEVLGEDYVRTARAKGLRRQAIVVGHAFRNASLPLVTLVAIDLPELFAGALVTETVFAWPGMGRLYLESLGRLDYSVLMAILTVTAVLVILGNLLADVLYAALDPRVRYR